MSFSFEKLRRFPDVEAPNLFASDTADPLILDEAADAIAGTNPGEIVVIGDNYGALTLGAIAQFGARGIRVHQDLLTGERAILTNAKSFGLNEQFAFMELGEALLSGARVVLLRLPKSLIALREIVELIAAYAAPDVAVYAGSKIKHMTRAMNDVFAQQFICVEASLARQKARVLCATDRRDYGERSQWPHRTHYEDLDLWVCAHGPVFAGTSVDIGTRFLLGFLDQMLPEATRAIDLGCGTGVLATMLAKARPAITVLASDRSAAAVASARATAEANGVADRVQVLRDDALSSQPDASAHLIMLNPPFHLGSSVHAGAGLKLIEDAGRVLAPGGELWSVFNSHLAYQKVLGSTLGRTRQVGRNDKFTATRTLNDRRIFNGGA